MGGDKREEEIRCRFLASRGYIAVTMNYELFSAENMGTFSVDAVMDEIDAAILRLGVFLSERDVILTRIATSGYSAGAHLSMMYAFSRADTAPLDVVFSANLAGPADISSEIWGCDTAAKIATIVVPNIFVCAEPGNTIPKSAVTNGIKKARATIGKFQP